MMVVVLLGALTLGACVDDNESASVTAVRNAKAKQLEAVAAWYNAQAEAETIKANAEAQLKAAEAAFQQAQADATAEETAFNKQKYVLELAKIKAQYDQQIAEAKKNAALADQTAWDNASKHLQNLYEAYTGAVGNVYDLNEDLIDAQFRLANAQVDYDAAYAAYKQTVINQTNIIANNTASIERLKALKVEDKVALNKQLEDMAAQAYNLQFTDKPAAEKV